MLRNHWLEPNYRIRYYSRSNFPRTVFQFFATFANVRRYLKEKGQPVKLSILSCTTHKHVDTFHMEHREPNLKYHGNLEFGDKKRECQNNHKGKIGINMQYKLEERDVILHI